MKMSPGQYARLRDRRGTPVRVKKRPDAKVKHFSAPLKGLSRYAELNEADPLLASVLTNFIVEEDRITVRPGYIQVGEISGNPPISTMVPYYGEPHKLAAAADGALHGLSGTVIASGYGSDDWAWASFSDLSDVDYTIMVNGADGVVSWDGTTFAAEAVTAPVGETWIVVDSLDKVLSHMNRLFFADSANMAVYYLPVQEKTGELEIIPLNAIFKHGGHIVSIATWTIDGGAGMDDQLVIFTSNGECAIYSGVDPASDWKLVGVFHFDAPMSKNSVINFGGDLYVMVSSGLFPMTKLITTETEKLGKADRNVMKDFDDVSKVQRDTFGWQVMLNHTSGHVICNMPLGGGRYQQMVRAMASPAWSKWLTVPSRCWGWLADHAYFGSDDGKIFLGGAEYLNDNGAEIVADVRFAWSSYKSVTKKQFKMVRLYTITDGIASPFIDMEVDYNNLPPTNRPDTTFGDETGAAWDIATWDVDRWAVSPTPRQNWQGVVGLGRVGAPRIRVAVLNCVYSITGVDVLYSEGGLM